MAKLSLADSVDESEIIKSDEEVNKPNILIDDDYGIVYDDTNGQCVLVYRTIAHRTGKEEDIENNGKIIRFTKWKDVGYCSDEFSLLRYYKSKVSKAKGAKLDKCKSFAEITKVYADIDETIKRVLNVTKMPEETRVNKLIEEMESRLKKIDSIMIRKGIE